MTSSIAAPHDELTDAHKAFHTITVYAYQLDHEQSLGRAERRRISAPRGRAHAEIAGRNVFRVTGKRFRC
ncbi:MAG: hypothetical protein ACLT2F_04820 [Butyricicoccus sp.]